MSAFTMPDMLTFVQFVYALIGFGFATAFMHDFIIRSSQAEYVLPVRIIVFVFILAPAVFIVAAWPAFVAYIIAMRQVYMSLAAEHLLD